MLISLSSVATLLHCYEGGLGEGKGWGGGGGGHLPQMPHAGSANADHDSNFQICISMESMHKDINQAPAPMIHCVLKCIYVATCTLYVYSQSALVVNNVHASI